MLVSVRVTRLGLDPTTATPVVVLGGDDERLELPIWIGPAEGTAIAVRLAGKTFSRPLTHDLMVQVIAGFGGALEKVVIDRMEAGVIHARLVLQRAGQTLTLDARPSDAIAAALRTGAGIELEESFLAAPFVELEPWKDPEPLAGEAWEGAG
jgi:bifunctional DNase/RNase